MKVLKIELISIITMHFIAFTVSEDFEIFRARENGSNGWTIGTDTFHLPLSLCGADRNDAVNCERFGAKVSSENGQKCLCSCPNGNATLMYRNDEWRCLKNSLVRDLLGYDAQTYIHFLNENKDNELRMLNTSDNRRVALSRWLSKCRVHEDSSRLVGCDGSEASISSTLFTLQREGNYDFPYYLKVNTGVTDSDIFSGGIIKLGIRCGRWRKTHWKLLFKYEGKLTCSISIPTVQPSVTTRPQTTLTLSPTTSGPTDRSAPTTSHIISSASYIPTKASDSSATGSEVRPTITEVRPTVSDSPPTITKVHPTVTDTPSITYEISPAISDTSPSVSEVRPSTSDTPPTTPDTKTVSRSDAPAGPNPDSEQRADDNSTSLALIGGIAATVLVIVVIVGFLVYRRCYAKPKPYSSTRCKVEKEPVDENAYKELDFNREQPMYASNYQVPRQTSETHFTESDLNTDHVYAPLNISEGQNLYGHVNSQEPICNVLENPTCNIDITSLNQNRRPISAEQPLYNLVEELTVKGTEKPDNQPVYNVLEGPYLEGSEGVDQYGAMCTEEPFYNTLEKPSEERPDTELINEPIYNVLEEEPYPDVSRESDDYSLATVQRPYV